MDALFAAHLGDTAKVQVRACPDPSRGKGVFALHNLEEGDVIFVDTPLAFLSSLDLTAAAAVNNDSIAAPRAWPRPIATCAACG